MISEARREGGLPMVDEKRESYGKQKGVTIMLIRNQTERSVKRSGSHQVGAVLDIRGWAGVEAVSGVALRAGTAGVPLALW